MLNTQVFFTVSEIQLVPLNDVSNVRNKYFDHLNVFIFTIVGFINNKFASKHY
jgi:hypothetical protein